MNLLTNEQQKFVIFVKKNLKDKHVKDKKYSKDKNLWYYALEYIDAAHSTKYKILCT